MPLRLRITRAQIEKAMSQIHALRGDYKTPMARFQTDRNGWIIEVEHLEKDGSNRLKGLESVAKQVGDELELTVATRTGAEKREQYHLEETKSSTYAVKVQLQSGSQKKANYFKR